MGKMALSKKQNVVFFLVFLAIFAAVRAEDEVMAEDEVDIRPGSQQQEYEMKLVDATCKFSYIAQGGTNEKWKMVMYRNPDSSEFVCNIERENGLSYLFFEQFKLEILSDFYGNDFFALGDNKVPLEIAEYKVNYKKASIENRPDTFKSKLSHVEVMAKRRSLDDEL